MRLDQFIKKCVSKQELYSILYEDTKYLACDTGNFKWLRFKEVKAIHPQEKNIIIIEVK